LSYRHILLLCRDLLDAFIEQYRLCVETWLKQKNRAVMAKKVEEHHLPSVGAMDFTRRRRRSGSKSLREECGSCWISTMKAP